MFRCSMLKLMYDWPVVLSKAKPDEGRLTIE